MEALKGNNYYQILGVPRTASQDELKRAYRKLALKLHPDKNSDEGAVEAFTSITKAFGCLSDPDRRSVYDLTGCDGPQGAQSDINNAWAKQIFREFFSKDVDYQEDYRRPPHYLKAQSKHSVWPILLKTMLLPLLVVALVGLLTGRSYTEVDFSLVATYRFTQERFTSTHNIPYYVDPTSYSTLSKAEGNNFEARVEREYTNLIQRDFTKAHHKRNNLTSLAQRSSDSQAKAYQDEADDVNMRSCEQLTQLTD
jgi:curved DNA-binding protein CbpA